MVLLDWRMASQKEDLFVLNTNKGDEYRKGKLKLTEFTCFLRCCLLKMKMGSARVLLFIGSPGKRWAVPCVVEWRLKPCVVEWRLEPCVVEWRLEPCVVEWRLEKLTLRRGMTTWHGTVEVCNREFLPLLLRRPPTARCFQAPSNRVLIQSEDRGRGGLRQLVNPWGGAKERWVS